MPGPERDYFSTWAGKHIPGLDLGSLPSMSIMGSEVARIGFGNAGENRVSIAESPFEDGRTAMSAAAGGGQGNGLDKAAAAVETWLRGAFAKMPGPGTPVLGPRGRTGPGDGVGDLIELTDTNSDDGRGSGSTLVLGDVLGPEVFGPTGTGWSAAEGSGKVRGRTGARTQGGNKDGKTD